MKTIYLSQYLFFQLSKLEITDLDGLRTTFFWWRNYLEKHFKAKSKLNAFRGFHNDRKDNVNYKTFLCHQIVQIILSETII